LVAALSAAVKSSFNFLQSTPDPVDDVVVVAPPPEPELALDVDPAP
jgi:hypothetical protein